MILPLQIAVGYVIGVCLRSALVVVLQGPIGGYSWFRRWFLNL